MRISFLAAATLAAFSFGAAAHEDSAKPANEILQRLDGHWSGDGTWLGKPSWVMANWTTTLSGAFVRLDYEVRGTAASPPLFAGTGYYKPAAVGANAATWFDSQGSVHSIETIIDGARLTALWGATGTPVGRTTYSIEGDRLIIEDAIRGENGEWRGFSRSELRRNAE